MKKLCMFLIMMFVFGQSAVFGGDETQKRSQAKDPG